MEKGEIFVVGILLILTALVVLLLWRQGSIMQDQKAILQWLGNVKAYQCLNPCSP